MREERCCPFCGRKGYARGVYKGTQSRPSEWFIRCEHCRSESGMYETEGEAWDAWNTRHTPLEVTKLLEVVRGLLAFIKMFNMGGDWEQGNYPAIKEAQATLAKVKEAR